MKKMILVVAVLLLPACNSGSPGLQGTYKNGSNNGSLSLSFKPNNKVSSMGHETSYQVNGDKIKFSFPGGGEMTLTKNSDGALDGGAWGKFTKE